MTHRTRALPLLLFAVLAISIERDARAEEPLVVAQIVAAEPTPDPQMRELLESLPRDQRRAVVRELRNQPAGERAAWRKNFLAQPPAARQQQIEVWTAQRGAVGEEAPRADRQALREQLAAMKPEERKQLRSQIAQLQQMSPEERARLEANLARWKTLSPAERDRMRARWRRFQQLPAAERERILQARNATQDAPSEPKP
jgi:hypothetical protein